MAAAPAAHSPGAHAPAPHRAPSARPDSVPPVLHSRVPPNAARPPGQRDILRASQKVPVGNLRTRSPRRWPLVALTVFATAVLVLGVALKVGGSGEGSAAIGPTAAIDGGPAADASAPPAALDAALEIPAGMTLITGGDARFFVGREPVSRADYLALFPKQKPGGSGPDAAVTRVSRTYAAEFAQARGARLATAAELELARQSKQCASTGLHEWTSDSKGRRPIALSPQGKAVARKDRGYNDQTFRLVLDLPKKKN